MLLEAVVVLTLPEDAAYLKSVNKSQFIDLALNSVE